MNNRFKRRMTVLCMAALAAVLAVIHTAVYFTGRDDMETQMKESAKGVAVSVANCIVMDAGEYRAFLGTMDVGSAYYKRLQAYLASVKEAGKIQYIYTERRIDDSAYEFVLDGEPAASPKYSKPGDRERLDRDRHGEVIAIKEGVYSKKEAAGYRSADFGKWGRLLGAFAPIVGEDGEVLGRVGVDIDGSHLYSHLSRVNRALLTIDALILAVALASLLGFSDAVIDRLFKDKLTGAYTKRYFDVLLHDEIARCVRHGRGMALLMADLDHFKKVNDEYGHVFGDRVLAAASEAIRGAIRPSDCFVRYGGEEFAVILPGVGPRSALEAAERVRRSVEESPVPNEEAQAPIAITISVGVANFSNLTQDAAALVEGADRALYQAKATRNAVAVFR
jgi:diguanylate cyclase (GGDEF)-like protein